jgi:hypothetical protein
MLSPLSALTYRRLFLAQVLSLLGTGLVTVTLGLLALESGRGTRRVFQVGFDT